MTIDETIELELEIEETIDHLLTTKELTAPTNFDFMFLLGFYAPIVASLHFQFFSAFFHVFYYNEIRN